MYDIDEAGEPVGVVNDFDLATWVDHSTANNDRTGTIPFMAIDLLDGGLKDRIPRLYRHDMESFSWILAYITVANIEYKDCSINISSFSDTDCEAWFRDGDTGDRRRHVDSKKLFHDKYGWSQAVSLRYDRYFNVIQCIARHWSDFHRSPKIKGPRVTFGKKLASGKGVPRKPEVDDPAGSVWLLIKSLEAADAGEEFAWVKARLLKAIAASEAASTVV
jgi:hypothetical protein